MNALIVATGNRKKIEEIRRMLEPLGITVITPEARGLHLDVVEDGETFVGNAVRKAVAWAEASGLTALADDSGLEVDALGGAPGVHSSRFAGLDGDDAANNALLLDRLSGVPAERRTARFRCVLALVSLQDSAEQDEPVERGGWDSLPVPGAAGLRHGGRSWSVRTFAGTLEGEIAMEPSGVGGFGYDPLFRVGEGHTLAELSASQKDGISHRGNALRQLVSGLRMR